jgi:integrase
VRDFVAELRRQKLSNGYIRRILANGSAALNRAHREGEITAAPRIDLSLAPEGEPRERLATIDEMRALFAAVRHDHERVYLMLAIGTAARPESILQLTGFQVDCENRLIRLNPPGRAQNKKRRPTVPMCETLAGQLYGLPAGPVVRYVTTSKAGMKSRALGSIRTTFRRLTARARRQMRDGAAERVRRLRRTGRRGEALTVAQEARARGEALLEITPYTIRHTMAAEMRRRGVPVWEVAGFLGHSSGYKTTERYAKFGPDHLSAAVRAIDSFFADLGVAAKPLPDHVHRLRASSVLVPDEANWQVLENMVEPDGIEPTTSTMPSKQDGKDTNRLRGKKGAKARTQKQ